MKFNSKSITLNKGVSVRHGVWIPQSLTGYSIPMDVWDTSIKEFNDSLDKRREVKEVIDGVELDILRLGLTGNTFYLWVFTKAKDADIIQQKMLLTFKGEIVFAENEKDIDKIVIEDLLYKFEHKEEWKSIFRKSLTSC